MIGCPHKSQPISNGTKTNDNTLCDIRNEGLMPELFPRMDIESLNLDKRV